MQSCAVDVSSGLCKLEAVHKAQGLGHAVLCMLPSHSCLGSSAGDRPAAACCAQSGSETRWRQHSW